MLGMIFGARYMLVLMGIFAIYVGVLYNEAFAVGLELFGPSKWRHPVMPGDEQMIVCFFCLCFEVLFNARFAKKVVRRLWHLSDWCRSGVEGRRERNSVLQRSQDEGWCCCFSFCFARFI